jgi:hypothetical protein
VPCSHVIIYNALNAVFIMLESSTIACTILSFSFFFFFRKACTIFNCAAPGTAVV